MQTCSYTFSDQLWIFCLTVTAAASEEGTEWVGVKSRRRVPFLFSDFILYIEIRNLILCTRYKYQFNERSQTEFHQCNQHPNQETEYCWLFPNPFHQPVVLTPHLHGGKSQRPRWPSPDFILYLHGALWRLMVCAFYVWLLLFFFF